ncbi:MAG TPA: Wzz/FepE/Etk N-terminal domain-containing protein, partial [Syntrophobacteraceae bacterium]|nr:Wzz/FepE/Etk N-terminal domain-containing protein [Syntrophobacteraceae bacterium]
MDEPLQEDMENEVDLFDCLLILAKRLKHIVTVTFGIAILGLIISLILPNQYEGIARVLPAQQGTPSISGMLMNQVSSTVGGLAGATPSDVYAEILKGDTISNIIIDRFHLMELFETDTRLYTRKALSDISDINADKKSNIITITITDKEPQRAADMANAFVEELIKLNNKLAITTANQRKLFYETQLQDTREALARAEESLKHFMETTGAIRI